MLNTHWANHPAAFSWKHGGNRYWTWVSSHHSSRRSCMLSEDFELKWNQAKQHSVLGDSSNRLTMAQSVPGIRKQTHGPWTEQLVLKLRVLPGLHASPNIDASRNVFFFHRSFPLPQILFLPTFTSSLLLICAIQLNFHLSKTLLSISQVLLGSSTPYVRLSPMGR